MRILLNPRRGGVRALAVLVLGGIALVPACTRKTPPKPEAWAEVDGQPIYREQVERILRSRSTTGSAAPSPEQALILKMSILNELINNRILVAHASRSRIIVSEAEVDTRVKELESPYSKEEFERKLAEQGLDRASLRHEVRETLTISKLVNKDISSHTAVTDAEIAQYFERNKASFNYPETAYRLLHIQVTPAADGEVRNSKNDDASNPAAAERKIQALYARLRSGEDFATVAQEYSEDPRTTAGGGDMGFIPASALDSNAQLRQVVLSLKVGEISGIIRTASGYHIIKLLAREERGQRDLADPQVRNTILQTLRSEREQLFRMAYLEKLRCGARVINYLSEQIVTAGGVPSNLR